MDTTLIGAALQQGLWAALFVSLYLYQLKSNGSQQDAAKGREDKLYTFITDITKQFEILAKQYEHMSEDIREIKTEIHSKD